MNDPSTVVLIGAACFGVVVGYLTYRTLARSGPTASVSDLAAVVAVIGGGTVTVLYGEGVTGTFGWYAIGLLGGMILYAVAALIIQGKKGFGVVMGDDVLRPPT